jgi:hypothetical protein
MSKNKKSFDRDLMYKKIMPTSPKKAETALMLLEVKAGKKALFLKIKSLI